MVVNSALLNGSLSSSRPGVFSMECKIDPNYCNLQNGLWQMSLDSVHAKVKNDAASLLKCTASIALSWFNSVQQEANNPPTFLPSPLTVLKITQKKQNEVLELLPSRARHWHTFQNVEQNVTVSFKILNSEKNSASEILNMDVQVVILLEKMAS
jgi:hypothetical protein